jgi:hypothetical protein
MGLVMDGYDIVVEGITEPDESDGVRRWAQAGATWCPEANWEVPQDRAVQVVPGPSGCRPLRG